MIPERVLKMLNNQINAEFYSAYLYLSMSNYYEGMNLKGFAKWMKIQAKEELGHAMKIYEYVIERGEKVKLMKIESPPSEWSSPLNAFEEAYAHEVKITKMINNIYAVAMEEKDFATVSMLKWFIDEQVEEEASTNEIVQKIKLAGEERLFLIDKELEKARGD
ncbi:MAG: ferritin [Thermoplasmatales archaeon]|nr:ferritin [Thermoplasmatales archaeon]